MEYMILVISAILVKNIVLAQYLGCCPFLGVSKKLDTALGMGSAVVFVMTLATAITWGVNYGFLVPLGIEYLQTIVFILVIAALVQLVEMFLKKLVPPLYKSLGIFLPLITTNCAVLGVAIKVIRADYGFLYSVIFALSSGIGFTLALVLFAGIREKFEVCDIPKALQGTAIGLIMAGLMALAFFGFAGVDSTLKAIM